MGRIQANLASRVKKGRMSEGAAQAAMARVKARAGGRAVRAARAAARLSGQPPLARPRPACLLPRVLGSSSCPCCTLQGTLDYKDFGSVEMVVEAAIEDLKVKQGIFADLERACRK